MIFFFFSWILEDSIYALINNFLVIFIYYNLFILMNNEIKFEQTSLFGRTV